MEQDPGESIKDNFADLSIVKEIKLASKGQHRIVVYFDDEGQMAEIDVLKCLAQAKTPYREMIRGE